MKLNAHANFGRLVSLIDISSQVKRGACTIIYYTASIVFFVVVGAGSLMAVIPLTVCWGIAHGIDKEEGANYFRGKAIVSLHLSIAAPLAVAYQSAVGTIRVGWRILVIGADVLGVFLPEIGRCVRLFDVYLREKEKDTSDTDDTNAQGTSGTDDSSPEGTSGTEDSIPEGTSGTDDECDAINLQKEQHEDALTKLGLSIGATTAEIRQVYKKLAMQYHPNRLRKDEERLKENEERFKEINGAHEFLIGLRRQYFEDKKMSREKALVKLGFSGEITKGKIQERYDKLVLNHQPGTIKRQEVEEAYEFLTYF